MKQRIQLLAAGMMIVTFGAVSALVPATTVAALDPSDAIKEGVDGAGGAGTGKNDFKNSLKQIVNVLLFLLGTIAVIMVIVGGIRYTLSGGDSSAITAAKNTVLYALVGVVVAILAYAIVNWLIDQFA